MKSVWKVCVNDLTLRKIQIDPILSVKWFQMYIPWKSQMISISISISMISNDFQIVDSKSPCISTYRLSLLHSFQRSGIGSFPLEPVVFRQGFLTGGTQAAITYPTEYVKTQLQLQSFLSWGWLPDMDETTSLHLSNLIVCLFFCNLFAEKISYG